MMVSHHHSCPVVVAMPLVWVKQPGPVPPPTWASGSSPLCVDKSAVTQRQQNTRLRAGRLAWPKHQSLVPRYDSLAAYVNRNLQIRLQSLPDKHP